jgi:1-acyl-sn-glycerol-3-phosphate acyltransferase
MKAASPLEKSQKMGFVRRWFMLALNLFFSKIVVSGQENIPMDKPVMFTPNHQNAFLDAILTGVYAVRQPYFLARGDIFQNKIVASLLKGIHIWPVFRIRDGKEALTKNQAIFDSVGELLKQGASITMFPEASHQLGYQLLPVRKGFARIALLTEAQTDFKLDAQIVPVAIHYEMHKYTGTQVFIHYGEPIATRDFEAIYRENSQKGLNAFRKTLDRKLRKLLVDWDREGERPTFQVLRLVMGDHEAIKKNALLHDEQLKAQLDQMDLALLSQYCNELQEASEALGLDDRDLMTYCQNEKTSYARLILSAIPSAYAWINHQVVLQFVAWLVGKFEDGAFHASMRYAGGVIVLPLTYLLQTLIVGSLIGWQPWGWLYGLSLPVSGLILLKSHPHWLRFQRKRRLSRKKQQYPQIWQTWEQTINKLRKMKDAVLQ